ncbi:putative Methyltransferase-domain-containing protein [Seiridium cardinale]
MDVDEPLLLFRAQYLQCLDHDFLTWPPPALLRQPDAQSFLYKHIFDPSRLPHRPPVGYEKRVLKTLIARIQRAAGSNSADGKPLQYLTSLLARLETTTASPDSLAQQDAYMTYNCSTSLNTWHPVTLHESRSLISGSTHTGHRTWEGALHLASYLLGNPSLVSNKRVLELGAGTGFLGILCRKHLDARQVTATDGDEKVVDEMRENLELNGLKEDDAIAARKLWWGKELLGDWQGCEHGSGFDTVIGADIIYQKEATQALVEALRALLDLQPRARMLLSNALRFPDVFEIFRQECTRNSLSIHIVDYQVTPPPKQRSLFYSTAMSLQIVEIRDWSEAKTP